MKSQVIQSASNEIAKNLIKNLLQISLELHNVNTNINADEVFAMLDSDQLQIYKDSIDSKLKKSMDAGISPRRQLMKNDYQ